MTTLPATPATAAPQRAAVAPAVAAAGLGAFLVSMVAAAAATPGYSHVEEHISALASQVNPHPWIMSAGFLGLAVSLFAAAVALRRSLPSRAVGVLLALGGSLIAVAGLAREDCSTAQAACAAREVAGTVSGAHMLHQLASLPAFVLVIAALFVCARALKRAGRAFWTTRAMALIASALVVVLVSGAADGAEGLVQRAFILVTFGWPVLLARTNL